MFDLQDVTFFHSELLLDNSVSFTSSRMNDLCQKWKVKLIFRSAWSSLMAWPDWPRPQISRQIYATAVLTRNTATSIEIW